MKHQIKTQVRVASFDNDHTMVGFFHGAVPAWRQELPKIARRLGISLEEAGAKIGTIFAKYATHDYPWAVALAFHPYWKGSVKDFVRLIERPFWKAQDEFREKYVKPFPGVERTLTELHNLGVKPIVVSDAPMFMCLARLASSGLAKYFEGVYALECKAPETNVVPSEEWLKFGHARIKQLNRKYAAHGIKIVRELPLEFEKPDPRGIQMAMEDFKVHPGQIIHVGDSLPKDGVLGLNAGLRGFFYTPYYAIGHLPPEYLEFITEVLKPETDAFAGHGATPATAKPLVAVPPMLAQGAFGDVLNHLAFHNPADYLELRQSQLFRA